MFKFLLYPLAWFFALLVWLRNAAFRWGIFSVKRLDQPVISIGNLAMGGTGKSPVCAALIGILQERGKRVALLSRGYGRKNPELCLRVEPDGDWRLCGDEPLMIARRHAMARVAVGPSRFAAAMCLPADSVDVFVIDDGFQHRYLARNFDVVLIDLTQPWPRMFPLERFREGWGALKRADLVVLTRWHAGLDTAPWEQKIRTCNPSLPLLKVGFEPVRLLGLDGSSQPLTFLDRKKIGAFCGIARPEPFFESLEALGAIPEVILRLKDHQPMTEPRLKFFAQRCRERGLEVIVTTEKDAVKLDKNWDFDILVYFLSIEVKWEDQTSLNSILDRLLKGS